ncbi:MAG: STAS domain-containing protein [Candidatus Wallbacteria bacterium]|nr:STAS domain-containing protein [Candidatus Wallbacteria bacterium]
MDSLRIDKEKSGQVTLIRISGEFDFQTGGEFLAFVKSLTADELKKVVLNMSGVEWIDSGSLGAVVNLFQKVNLVKGRIILSDLSGKIRKVLQLTNLDSILPTADTERDALAQLEEQ